MNLTEGHTTMKQAYNQDSQKQAIIGAMAGLIKELQTLAPHPEKPDHIGPLFINCELPMNPANDHDGMLGSLMMESLLGTAFAEAISESFGSWTQDVNDTIDVSNALECYSEYITDIEGKDEKKNAAHGQGTLARLSGKSISNSFNLRTTIDSKMQAFMDDMPRRMKIEKTLAYYAKQFKMLDAPLPAYNAPKPAFAA